MKTKQDILKEVIKKYPEVPWTDEEVKEAMELYSQEQNAELVRENQELSVKLVRALQQVTEIENLRGLVEKTLTLWNDLAEAGQLTIGPEFIVTYEALLSEADKLIKK